MAIDKSPIWVGSINGENGIIESNGLKLMRRYETFEGNRETEYIKVVYTEWWQNAAGTVYNLAWKSYFVKDIAEVPAVYDNDNLDNEGNPTLISDNVPAYLGFTNWFTQLGSPVIVPAINGALIAIPFDANDGYLTKK